MLIQHMQETTRSIGDIILQAGINQVEDNVWDTATKSKKWKKPITGLIKDGIIKVLSPNKKLSVDMVKETFDINLLKEWEQNPDYKGPLKGAIRTQIEAVELVEKED